MGAIYCTAAEVLAKYPKLSQVTSLIEASINLYIAGAEAEINLRLSNMYNVPFSIGVNSFPPVISEITKTLTILTVFDDNIMQAGDRMFQWLDSRRTKLDKLIDAIAVGSVTLVTSAGAAITKKMDVEIWGSREGFHPIFDVALAEEESIINQDLIDDEKGLRDDRV